MRVLSAPAPHTSIWSVIVPADGTSAANCEQRRLRCVAVLWQLSDKPLLVGKITYGVLYVDNNEASINKGTLRAAPARIDEAGYTAREIMAVLGHKRSRRAVRFCGSFSGNWLSAAALMQLLPIVPISSE
jgi:hypothetical protein